MWVFLIRLFFYMSSLRDKTFSGVFWSLLQNVGGKGITFLVTLLLARLLSPEEFGLIGMLSVFIQISQMVVEGGFSQALIRKQDATSEDYASVFYINLIVSLLLYVVLFFSAPFIASFYRQPLLSPLTRVLGLIFVFNAFSLVQEAILTKEMKFKKLMTISIPSTVIGGVVSIVMAMMNFGVWSIVAQQLVTRLAYAVQIWMYTKWRPVRRFDLAPAKELFSFGSKLMVSNIIITVYQNIYLVVIGKFFSVSSVGYYQTANNLVQYPASTFCSALNKVAFPLFASMQHDNQKLKAGYKKVILQLLFWICPIFILAGVLAEPMFRLLFTEKWVPAVPYFQWLCIVGILFPVNLYNLNILNVKGRSDIFLKLEIIKKVVITIGLVITIPMGIYAMLVFQAVNAVFTYVLNSYYSGRFIDYSIGEQVKDILPIILLGCMMGLLVYVVNYYLKLNSDLIRLIGGLAIGAVFYWFCAYIMNFSAYKDLIAIVQNRLLKRVRLKA